MTRPRTKQVSHRKFSTSFGGLICKCGTFYGLPILFSVLLFYVPLLPINFLKPPEQMLFLFEATSYFFRRNYDHTRAIMLRQ